MIINALFFWIGIALLFLILEVGHPSLFFFLSFCISSVISAFLAFFDFSLMTQCVVFLPVLCIALMLLNRFAKYAQHTRIKTNIYALEGKQAVVTAAIRPPNPGQVKVEGEVWSARSLKDEVFVEGTVVLIVQVRGAHLVVK